jgi:hypothetical protein
MKTKKLFLVFDNGGETFDRYTIILHDGSILGASERPFSHMGFGQFCGDVKPSVREYIKIAKKEQHLGHEIKDLAKLPEDVLKFANQYLS